ncbi:MAG: hypothetical protein R2867_44970 [Caldilineaceae bacterium]
MENMLYSTYFGGSYNGSEISAGDDVGTGIAVGADGSIYVTGYTFATDFPVANAMQATKRGADNFPDAFVARLNPTNNTLLFSTYVGGDEWDEGHALELDDNGNVTIGGMTNARNFPILNASQSTLGNGICNLGGTERYCYDGFVTQLSTDGILRLSTYIGGGLDDNLLALGLDGDNNLIGGGGSESPNFPVSGTAYQANKALQRDGFWFRLGRADEPTTPTATVSPTLSVSPTPVTGPTATPTATPTPPGDERVLLPMVHR